MNKETRIFIVGLIAMFTGAILAAFCVYGIRTNISVWSGWVGLFLAALAMLTGAIKVGQTIS